MLPVLLQLPYSTALAAVFIEGWIFVLLSITGVRAAIIRLVPRCVLRVLYMESPRVVFRAWSCHSESIANFMAARVCFCLGTSLL